MSAQAGLVGAPTLSPRAACVKCSVASGFRPWYAQRAMGAMFFEAGKKTVVVVAGRQSGKTRAAAKVMLEFVMDSPPGSMGAVLAPTYIHAEAAANALRALAAPLGAVWKEQKHTLELPVGRIIRVFSADRKETVRGPSICFLWLEEAALLHVKAVEAALGALAAVQGARILVTTTPMGKNWVFPWWEQADGRDPTKGRIRFRTEQSPYHDASYLAEMRNTLPAEVYAQEFEAVFVESIDLVFKDRTRLFVDAFPPHDRPGHVWLGVDLGRTTDYTVIAAMDAWCEAEMLWRGRQEDLVDADDEERFWPMVTELVLGIARRYPKGAASVVLDTGGPAGGPGAVLAGYLRESDVDVFEVNTSAIGTKAAFVEQAQADVEFGTVHVKMNDLARVLDAEMARFIRVKRAVQGREVNIYEGPQIRGVHDDAVIAFCLANWGRVNGDKPFDLTGGTWGNFAAQAKGPSKAVRFGDPI